ncbi:MAG: cytochrome o ubiquinol oxidase subunit III [Chlamydiae bacterium RIFCSPHIGHO2_12_FULL_49_11]|nr:MAG: cytochrome o ubiquinol oxidase subunit III [Chlamydiae bacterium RIFCSPHIGHO2_12_FULL_49_11]
MHPNLALHHEETYEKTVFGFWVYLMTDCLLFGSLFATFIVLSHATFGGPSGKEIFSLPYILAETFVLLTSTYTCGFLGFAARKKEKTKTLLWLFVTFLLGLTFVVMEVREFVLLVLEGNGWSRSGFLSAYFTLVGTHGTHVSFGLIWMLVLFFQILFRDFTHDIRRRMMCLRLFWHFLDVVWIFIFTFVYLFGVI